jgi:hypothetical protein
MREFFNGNRLAVELHRLACTAFRSQQPKATSWKFSLLQQFQNDSANSTRGPDHSNSIKHTTLLVSGQ